MPLSRQTEVAARQNAQTRAGVAILEMLFAELLLFSFIGFVLVIGRVMSERNRLLAATRTVAWLKTHCTDPEAARQTFASPAFARQLRRWHFIDSGPAAGVVRVGPGYEGSGVMAQFAEKTKGLEDQVNSEFKENGNEKLDESNLEDGVKKADDPNVGGKEEGTPLTGAFDKIGDMVSGLLNFFTSDFTWYRAEVEFGMPVSSSAVLKLMRGKMGVESLDKGELPEGGLEGGAYAFIRPGPQGGCVFPSLDVGADGAGLSGITDGLKNVIDGQMDKIKKSSKKNLYRPAIKEESDDQQVTAKSDDKRLYWLLVYEIEDDSAKDNPQGNARGDSSFTSILAPVLGVFGL